MDKITVLQKRIEINKILKENPLVFEGETQEKIKFFSSSFAFFMKNADYQRAFYEVIKAKIFILNLIGDSR
jgi:hypothetical protein